MFWQEGIAQAMHPSLTRKLPQHFQTAATPWQPLALQKEFCIIGCLHLVQDMADKSAEAKPLRRRAAMLLGQWAAKVPATERPAAYRSLIMLMGEADAAVQLAAVCSGPPLIITVVMPAPHGPTKMSHEPEGMCMASLEIIMLLCCSPKQDSQHCA